MRARTRLYALSDGLKRKMAQLWSSYSLTVYTWPHLGMRRPLVIIRLWQGMENLGLVLVLGSGMGKCCRVELCLGSHHRLGLDVVQTLDASILISKVRYFWIYRL